VAQIVGRDIALLFHTRCTRRGWAVNSTPRSHFTTGKFPVPIVQVAGWAPELVWTGGKSRPHGDLPYFNTFSHMATYKQRTNWSFASSPNHTPHVRWRASCMQLETRIPKPHTQYDTFLGGCGFDVDSIPVRPARSQSLYLLSYPAQTILYYIIIWPPSYRRSVVSRKFVMRFITLIHVYCYQ